MVDRGDITDVSTRDGGASNGEIQGSFSFDWHRLRDDDVRGGADFLRKRQISYAK